MRKLNTNARAERCKKARICRAKQEKNIETDASSPSPPGLPSLKLHGQNRLLRFDRNHRVVASRLRLFLELRDLNRLRRVDLNHKVALLARIKRGRGQRVRNIRRRQRALGQHLAAIDVRVGVGENQLALVCMMVILESSGVK